MFKDLDNLSNEDIKKINQYYVTNIRLEAERFSDYRKQRADYDLLILNNIQYEEWFEKYHSKYKNHVLLNIHNMETFTNFKNLGAKLYVVNDLTQFPQFPVETLESLSKQEIYYTILCCNNEIMAWGSYIYEWLSEWGLECIDYVESPKGYIHVIYSDVYKEPTEKSDYFIFNHSIGNFLTLLPVLYSVRKYGKNLDNFVFDNKAIYDLFNYFFSPATAILTALDFNDPIMATLYEKHKVFQNIKKMAAINTPNKSYFESQCDYYKSINYLPSNLTYDDIFNNFIKELNIEKKQTKKTGKTAKIAVQRLSAAKNFQNQYKKEWPINEMRSLLKLCENDNIEFINLCPDDEIKNEYHKDESNKNLIEMIKLMGEIDLFVGVGSSIGQLSSLTGTPSLSVFASNDIFENYFCYKYMPLYMNYSLFSKDGFIPADFVYDKIKDILNNKIILSEEYVPLSKRMVNKHYEYYNS